MILVKKKNNLAFSHSKKEAVFYRPQSPYHIMCIVDIRKRYKSSSTHLNIKETSKNILHSDLWGKIKNKNTHDRGPISLKAQHITRKKSKYTYTKISPRPGVHFHIDTWDQKNLFKRYLSTSARRWTAIHKQSNHLFTLSIIFSVDRNESLVLYLWHNWVT